MAEAQGLGLEVPAGLFTKRKAKTPKVLSILTRNRSGVSAESVRMRAEEISKLKLPYLFGGSSPSDGGMDCSGCIMYLFNSLGYQDVPRTSFDQYDWVRKNGRIKKSKTIKASDLSPGDLIFWGGTYKSGHKVSHIMMYMGRGTNGKLYMYGARSKSIRGVSGAGVDIHELRAGSHKNLIGYGRAPLG